MAVDRLAARAFDAMAEEYERGRPGWPADAVAELVERFGTGTVLDLAAGTGKLTAVLAEVAADVVAVEPVDGMRRVLEAEARFGPLSDATLEHEQRSDRDGLLALLASFSWIGCLPAGERDATLAAVRRVLERHGIGAVALRYRTTIVTTRRADG